MIAFLRDGDDFGNWERVGLFGGRAISLYTVNMYDIIVGAACATVRSIHVHKIDSLRLVRVWHPSSVCVILMASSLKRHNPRGAPCRKAGLWRPNLAEDRLK